MLGISIQVFLQISLLGLGSFHDELCFKVLALLLHHLYQFSLCFDLFLELLALDSFGFQLCSNFDLTFLHSFLDDLHL